MLGLMHFFEELDLHKAENDDERFSTPRFAQVLLSFGGNKHPDCVSDEPEECSVTFGPDETWNVIGSSGASLLRVHIKDDLHSLHYDESMVEPNFEECYCALFKLSCITHHSTHEASARY
mmetsp:Transcript_13535/g.37382  ORF Transcript_13535/g.37382 Transcript_13535/m.37382 type:complete len:120 (-) Transcript_13535:19-378(-)